MSDDPHTLQLRWRAAFRASMAITRNQFPMGRPDLGGWIARITGPDERFGMAREFLEQVYPIVFVKKPAVAFDFATVRLGDVLEVRGQDSRNAPFDAFYRVVKLTFDGIELLPITGVEAWKWAHRGTEKETGGGEVSTD